MRIAIFATCPSGIYSGGRYHALIAGYCLARRGHEVYFITNNSPIFDDDLRCISPENPVSIIVDHEFSIMPSARFDFVFIAPQLSHFRKFYSHAIRFAELSQAALVLFNYETPNWFNSLSPFERDEKKWSEWHMPVARGCLVLSSARESQTFAERYFGHVHPGTLFDVWQPAINSVACEAAGRVTREKKIFIFARPSDPHKGGDAVENLLDEAFADHKISVLIGNPRGAEEYKDKITKLASAKNISVEFLESLSDVEKFRQIKSSAALAFPSYFEGYGYPPIEALACDTPCVAYDLPVLRETCGTNVTFVPPGDTDALRDALKRVVNQSRKVTSNKPAIVELTDVDRRAAHLERTLIKYREDVGRKSAVSELAAPKVRISTSVPERFHFAGRRFIYFSVQCEKPISTAALASKSAIGSCWVMRDQAVGKDVIHHVIAALPDDSQVEAPLTLWVTFLRGQAITIDLPDGWQDREVVSAEAAASNAGVSRLSAEHGQSFIDGWALPKSDYDSAIWLTGSDPEFATNLGTCGLSNSAYLRQMKLTKRVECGLRFVFGNRNLLNDGNLLLLVRNSQIVFAAEMTEAVAAAHQSGIDLLPPHDPEAPVRIAPGSHHRVPAILPSKILSDSQQTAIRGWCNVVDRPMTFQLHYVIEKQRLLSRSISRIFVAEVGANVIRPDLEKAYALPRPDAGFGASLPPLPSHSTCEVTVATFGKPLTSVAFKPEAEPTEPLPHFAARRSAYSISRDTNGGSAVVISRPLKVGISRTIYDARAGTLTSEGWLLIKSSMEVSLVDKDGEIVLGRITKLNERPDVAAKYGAQYLRSGFKFSVMDQALSEKGYKIRFRRGGRIVEEIDLRVEVSNVKEFATLDQDFDPQWRILWMRGVFVQPGLRPEALHVLHQNRAVCSGTCNVKKFRLGETQAGWRVESILPEGIELGDDLKIELRFPGNAFIATRVKLGPVGGATALEGMDYTVARHGLEKIFRDEVLPPRLDGKDIVLLIIHNLDAVDRPEKLMAIESLRRALKKRKLELVIFHHGNDSPLGELPVIQFAHPFFATLDAISGDDLDEALEAFLPPAELQRITRATYGYYATMNSKPMSWSACAAQVRSEARRTMYVLDHLRPKGVLLWHQWNSLMEGARVVAGKMSIPSGYLHEGMLPKTMTFSTQGMMAEAECVGARLGSDAPQRWRDLAENVISRIRIEGMDRKPLSALSVAQEIRARADTMRAKVIFYAGINDWHSGNLPADGSAIHSPYFADTYDGLHALLSLAERNNWLVVFKPHPNLFPRSIGDHPRLVTVRESNLLDCIDIADVVVTILSSAAYIARIRGKPTVLLGRNTLSNTGAVYELTDRKQLRAVIKEALKDENAPAMREALVSHVAELLRHDLFAYDPDDSIGVLDHNALADRILSEFQL